MTHFLKTKATGLRQPKHRKTMHGVRPITASPAYARRLRSTADPLPIPNGGSRYTALLCEFANGHDFFLDLKLTLSITVNP